MHPVSRVTRIDYWYLVPYGRQVYSVRAYRRHEKITSLASDIYSAWNLSSGELLSTWIFFAVSITTHVTLQSMNSSEIGDRLGLLRGTPEWFPLLNVNDLISWRPFQFSRFVRFKIWSTRRDNRGARSRGAFYTGDYTVFPLWIVHMLPESSASCNSSWKR